MASLLEKEATGIGTERGIKSLCRCIDELCKQPALISGVRWRGGLLAGGLFHGRHNDGVMMG